MSFIKKNLKKIALGCLSFCCLLSATIGIALTAGALENLTITYLTEYLSEYQKDEEIVVPVAKVGDSIVDNVFTFPSGKTYYNAKTAKLTEQGIYKVRYSLIKDGTLYEDEKTFTVKNPIANFSKNDADSNFFYKYDEQLARNCLSVNFTEGNTFYYNKEIDISNASTNNPYVEFTVSPMVEGVSDLDKIYLSFTDAEDENNSVTIVVKTRNISAGWVYLQAKANGQLFTGYDANKKTVWIEGNYGASIEYTTKDQSLKRVFNSGATNAGVTLKDLLKKQKIRFWIDNEKKVYCSYYSFMNDNEATISDDGVIRTVFVTDLDDVSYQSELWQGFKSDKVFLSVYGETFNHDYANVSFTKIGNNALSTTGYIDESAGPEITVDFNKLNEDTLYLGEAGKNYPIFEARAVDLYCGVLPYQTKVFFNYERDKGVYNSPINSLAKEIQITDGYFETLYSGRYSIVYMAKDWFGNYTERVVNIVVENNNSSIDFTVNDDGDKNGFVGNVTKVSTINTLQGGVGNLQLDVKVKIPSGEYKPVYGNVIDGMYFVAESAGEYTVVYTATDYILGSVKRQYTVNITNSSNTVYANKVNLPKYFIAEQDYILPDLIGENLSTSQQNVKAEVTIIDGNGTRTYQCGSKVKISPDADGYVTFKYDAGKNSQEYKRKVVSVGNAMDLTMENFFACTTNINAARSANGVDFTINGEGNVEFVNALLPFNLSSSISFSDLGIKYNKASYVLTDSYDSSICIKVGLEYKDGMYYVLRNNDIVAEYAQMEKYATMEYTNNAILLNSALMVDFDKTIYGEKFDGFTSKAVYVTLEFSDIVENGGVAAYYSINSQQLTAKRDLVLPTIVLDNVYENLAVDINREVEVYSANYGDVLSGYTFGVVSVKDANGSYVKDVNGMELKEVDGRKSWKFIPTEYSEYTIEYFAADQAGMTFPLRRKLKVVDRTAPTLQVENMKAVYKKGVIEIPTITATDNVSAKDEIAIYVVVVDPKLQMFYVKDSNINTLMAGDYKVIITAMDKDGNSTIKTFEFVVVE